MPQNTIKPSLHEKMGAETSPETDGKKEIIWIHWAKAIGIFLVLMGHADTPHVIRSWIYSFHMPMFFFLSGYLAKSRHTMTFGKYIKRHARTLLMPYICLGIIAYAVWFLKNLVHPGAELETMARWEPLVNMLYATGYPVLRLVHSSSLWFLPALFSVFIIHWIVRQFCKGDIAYCLAAAGLFYAGYYSFSLLPFRLPMGMESAMICFSFFAVGNVAHKRNIGFSNMTSFVLGVLCFAVQFVLLYFQKWPIPQVLSGQLWMPATFVVTAMIGTCGLIGVVKGLPRLPAAVTISRNTLTIFTLEFPARLVFDGILYVLGIQFVSDGAKWTYGFASSVVVLVSLSLFADLIRKVCPIMLGEKR